jgi:hypothetical protein
MGKNQQKKEFEESTELQEFKEKSGIAAKKGSKEGLRQNRHKRPQRPQRKSLTADERRFTRIAEPGERCLACEAEAAGTMEGSRFCPDPVCTYILENPRLPGGRVRAGGSRERLLMSLKPTAVHLVYYQCNTISQTASCDVCGTRLLDNVLNIRRLFARSPQVTGNV